MNWLQRLVLRMVQPAAKMTIEEWWRQFGGENTVTGIHVNQHVAMTITTVFACCRRRAQDMAKLPPSLMKVKRGGGFSQDFAHPLARIFVQPNPWQTWIEFAEQMEWSLLLRGNAIAVVLRGPLGTPVGFVPVNFDRVSLYESPDGMVFYQVTRNSPFQVAQLRDYPLLISSDDILHLRYASSNTLVGLSPIGVEAEAIALAKAQEKVAAGLMRRGATPSGVLMSDRKLPEDAARELKTTWNETNAGLNNAGGTAVLEYGIKFQPLTMNSVDMEFIASRNFQVEEICRIFDVSPAKIHVGEEQQGRNFEQIQLAHATDAVHPDLVRWEQKLESFFGLDPQEYDVWFDETELLRADMVARANSARVLQVSGITKPNESRAQFRLNPDPDGDTLLVPANVVPIKDAGKKQQGVGPGSDQSGATGDGGSGDSTELPSDKE